MGSIHKRVSSCSPASVFQALALALLAPSLSVFCNVKAQVVAPGGVIYNGTGTTRYGQAIPGEKCLTEALEEEEWERVLKIPQERHRQESIKELLLQICTISRGYYCDPVSELCDCKKEDHTWEDGPEAHEGCHVLVNKPCSDDAKDDFSGMIHDCVMGAECGSGGGPPPVTTSTVPTPRDLTPPESAPPPPPPQEAAAPTAEPANAVPEKPDNDRRRREVEERVSGTCQCVSPGFRNCSENKEVPYSVSGQARPRFHISFALFVHTFNLLLF